MTRRRKEKYSAFKKHYIIPLILCGVLIISGIIMTLTNQVDSGQVHFKGGGFSNIILIGPGVIGIGIGLAIIISIYARKMK